MKEEIGMDDLDREIEYALRMRPLLKKNALYSDETEMFQKPMEPQPGDLVTIRFRTARNNADAVYLHHGDARMRMHFQECRDGFDFFSIQIKIRDEIFSYYFEIVAGNNTCFYCKLGVQREAPSDYLFRIIPGFHTPDWAKGCVMYQIYPDRFRNGDTSNDVLTDEYSYINEHVQRIEDWNQPPADMDVRNFYGGDLQGIIDKLDYLEKLGVEAIYLNPVFVSASNHKYDTQDYDYVDPHLGKIVRQSGDLLAPGDHDNTHAGLYISRVTDHENLEAGNQLFARLIAEAHARNIRVIIDGVFNHCGSFNKWMDRERIYEGRPGFEPGAYISEDSPYHDYFDFQRGSVWPYNSHYDGWWGHDTLPKLNYEDSIRLQEDILRIAGKWVSPPFSADGWRLDVAADLGHSSEFNHQFWKKFRQKVKEANPDAIILAEHYGDAGSWLKGDEWDTVMNYDAFMEPVSWFLTGMEKHSDSYREDLLGNADSFEDAMRYHMASFTMPSLLVAMNELDNHDHSGFLTRTNHKVGRVQNLGTRAAEEDIDISVLRTAVVIQMTWPGAPTVYYGDEAGVCGFTDPDNRRTYPWGRENEDLIRFYQGIIAVHRNHTALRTGSLKLLYKDYNVLAYGRFNEEEQIIVLVNNRQEDYYMEVVVWPAGLNRYAHKDCLTRIFRCDRDGCSGDTEEVPVEAGVLKTTIPASGALVFAHKSENPDDVAIYDLKRKAHR